MAEMDKDTDTMAPTMISESDISDMKYIAGGSTGEVFTGNWRRTGKTPMVVAIKKIRIASDEKVNEAIKSEIEFLQTLKHKNIIHSYGCYYSDSHSCIVMEYAAKGSLFDYLRKVSYFPGSLKVSWQIQAAESIQYLHEKHVLHRDIKSPNFVITSDDVLKLCDFGMARNLPHTKFTNHVCGTMFWLAPEVFRTGILSKKADIFALGVIIWEIETGEVPYSELGSGINPGHFNHLVTTLHRRPRIPGNMAPGMRALIEICWHPDYSSRPDITYIVHELKSNQQGCTAEMLSSADESGSSDLKQRGAVPKREMEHSEDVTSRIFQKKDRVRVKNLSTIEMIQLQDDHGGYKKSLGMSRGRDGTVKKMLYTGDVKVKLDSGDELIYNPKCLSLVSGGIGFGKVKGHNEVGGMKRGIRVRIRELDIEEMKMLQEAYGGYTTEMGLLRNGLGRVKGIDMLGKVKVKTDDGSTLLFNPACLEVVDKDAEIQQSDSWYKKGAGVRVTNDVDVNTMEEWQGECGGWIPEMAEIGGQEGVISKVTLARVYVRMHNGKKYSIDPRLLQPDDEAAKTAPRHLRKGDKVKVKEMPQEEMKKLQKGHGGWASKMERLMNMTGTVKRNRLGRAVDLALENGGDITLNTKCVVLVQETQDDNSSDDTSSSEDSDEDVMKKLASRLKRISHESESDGSISDITGPKLLQKEIERGDKDKVEQILKQHPDWVNMISDDGRATPLLAACRSGSVVMARLLVEAGASVNMGNTTQNLTPLILSAYDNRPELVKFLLQSGANVDDADEDGDTALTNAIMKNNDECISELLKPEYSCNVNKKNIKIISAVFLVIVRHTSDVTIRVFDSPLFDPKEMVDEQNMNSLQMAAAYGNARALAVLIAKWPEGINVKNRKGFTPLTIAANQSKTECVKLLLKVETCDIESQFNGATSVHHAAMKGDLDTLKVLVQHKADVNSLNYMGHSALFAACMMIKSRAALDFFSKQEPTQSLQANELPSPEQQEVIAIYLVENGAKIDINDQNTGMTVEDVLRLVRTDLYRRLREIEDTTGRQTHNTTDQNLQTKSPTTIDVHHTNIECDNCGMCPIRGIRHKCMMCPDYDLCEKCMQLDTHEHSEFIAYTRPKERKPTTTDTHNSDLSAAAMSSSDLPSPQMFKTYDSVEKSDTIIGNLKNFNNEMNESCELKEDDLTLISKLLHTATTASTEEPTVQQVSALWKILSTWPVGRLIPAFMVLHLAVRHRSVNQHLYQEDVGQAFVSEILTRAAENTHVGVQYMVCRTISNSFLHSRGQAFLLKDDTQDRIINTVLSFDDIHIGFLPENEAEQILRVDAATLLLNFAIALGNNKHSERGRCVNAVVDMLEHDNDPESNHRLLQALGTLFKDNESALAIGLSRDALKQVQRLKDKQEYPEEIRHCAKRVEQMLNISEDS